MQHYFLPIRGLYSNFWPIRSRQTSEECPDAIIMQCVQSIVGVIIQECKRQNLIKQTKSLRKCSIKTRSLRQDFFLYHNTLQKWFKGVKVKRFYDQWEWSLHCLIWCQKKSDFSWGFDFVLQACMAGIVFAKLSRPKKARNTVVFSKWVIMQSNIVSWHFLSARKRS